MGWRTEARQDIDDCRRRARQARADAAEARKHAAAAGDDKDSRRSMLDSADRMDAAADEFDRSAERTRAAIDQANQTWPAAAGDTAQPINDVTAAGRTAQDAAVPDRWRPRPATTADHDVDHDC